METQINNSLLSLLKISNLTAENRICIWNGDIDVYEPSAINFIYRQLTYSRKRMLTVLDDKYKQSRELISMILESNKHTDRLENYYQSLRSSREGLQLFKQNPLYKGNTNISNPIDHLLDTEIPHQLKMIAVSGLYSDVQINN